MRNGTEKGMKPSQRPAVTEFSKRFGTSFNYEDKAKLRKYAGVAVIIIGVILLITVGFFVTDVLIRMTEIPPEQTEQTTVFIQTEAIRWISFLTTRV